MQTALNILLVEDSPSDALLLQELVQESGWGRFNFTCAETLAQALDHACRAHFDALLVDLSLPDSSGSDTFLRMRDKAPTAPIVVLTGAGDETTGLEAVRHGIQDYLIKGKADGHQIARSIRYAIERKRVEDALEQSQKELRRVCEELELRVQDRTAELSAANQALQAEIFQRQRAEVAHKKVLRRLAEAQEIERGRFSRDLHDQLGQDLSALKLGLTAFRTQAPQASEAEQNVKRLEELADHIMRSMHRLAWELHPVVLDDFGLNLALQRYAQEWSSQSRIQVDFHSQGMEKVRIPAELETALYRVTQEALTNVARHAKAGQVSLLLERRADQVSLIIEDDGQGFDPGAPAIRLGPQGKLGLLGMRERIAMVGGAMEIEATPGSGTTIFIRIPLEAKL